MSADFRKSKDTPPTLHFRGAAMELVSNFKYLSVHLTTWTDNTSSLYKETHQCLSFDSRLRHAGFRDSALKSFYKCVKESVLCSCINVWYGSCSREERRRRSRDEGSAESSESCTEDCGQQPSLHHRHLYQQMQEKGLLYHETPHPPCTEEFPPLLSGKRLQIIRRRTTRPRSSFFPEVVIDLLW